MILNNRGSPPRPRGSNRVGSSPTQPGGLLWFFAGDEARRINAAVSPVRQLAVDARDGTGAATPVKFSQEIERLR